MKSKFLSLNANSRFGYLVRRCFAFALDWYLAALLGNVLIMIFQLLLKEVALYYQIPILLGSVFISSLIYFVFIPFFFWKGQTVMQRAMQVKVVNDDLSEVTFLTLAKRFFIGCLLFEGAVYSATTITVNIIIVTFFMSVAKQMDLVIGGLLMMSTLLSLIIASRDINNSKCFHDYFANTKVIDIKTIS